jgi:hypothetical protein
VHCLTLGLTLVEVGFASIVAFTDVPEASNSALPVADMTEAVALTSSVERLRQAEIKTRNNRLMKIIFLLTMTPYLRNITTLVPNSVVRK